MATIPSRHRPPHAFRHHPEAAAARAAAAEEKSFIAAAIAQIAFNEEEEQQRNAAAEEKSFIAAAIAQIEQQRAAAAEEDEKAAVAEVAAFIAADDEAYIADLAELMFLLVLEMPAAGPDGVIKVPADGNCLFIALAWMFGLDPRRIRGDLATRAEAIDEEHFVAFGTTKAEFIRLVLANTQWNTNAGDIIVRIFGGLWNVNVTLRVDRPGTPPLMFTGSNIRRQLGLYYAGPSTGPRQSLELLLRSDHYSLFQPPH